MSPDPLPGLIAAYAARIHRAASGHHVLSPLGAWLLLALVGPAAQGGQREELETVLGTDVDTAAGHARSLLAEPHPAVSAATAYWQRPSVATPALDAWTRSLPGATERGDIPSHAEADAWAAHVTHELIRSFPVEITDETVLLLANALATRISWSVPFTLTNAADLGTAWGPGVHQVLRSAATHRAFVADTAAAGRVGVHLAGSEDGLDVYSVVAGEGVPAGSVLAAAYEVAQHERPLALHALPLGDGHAWRLSEREEMVKDLSGREETSYALVPAWHAETRLDLLNASGLGFGPAVEALYLLLRPDEYEADAVQSAVASYTREGFEAAAVTAIGYRRVSAPARRPGTVRALEVRFTRPYAVVAVTRSAKPALWFGLPVFSAWVERADDAT
ncbi:MAG TPA: hypothetical protein VHX15_03450 [Frankiaceae bacterium]|nr:hypothetical protein [Frankiaceae bacterium]